MSLQNWADATANSCTSFNARMRAICTAISTALGITVTWYPDGGKPTTPVYPHVSGYFLNIGGWNDRRRKLVNAIQLDVFTNGNTHGNAQRIAGQIFTRLGLDPALSIMECSIAQTDTEAAKALPPRSALPLHDMTLTLTNRNGWEKQPDEDPAVSHLFTNFNLYYE